MNETYIGFIHNIFFDKDSSKAHTIPQLFSSDAKIEEERVIFEVQFFIERNRNSKSGNHQVYSPPPFGIC